MSFVQYSQEGQTIQWQITKEQTMIYKIPQRKLYRATGTP